MKPGLVWTLFGLGLGLVLVAMGWSSLTVLRLERAEAAAQTQAALEENARLALWRMDSALTALLAEESARPYFHYRPFYPVARSYARMFDPEATGEPVLPSPLLLKPPPRVLLHFQVAPGGQVTSPEVPEGRLRSLAMSLGLTTREAVDHDVKRLQELRASIRDMPLFEEAARQRARIAPQEPAGSDAQPNWTSQKMKNVKEFEARQQTATQANRAKTNAAPESRIESRVEEGPFESLWSRNALLLVRRVRIDGQTWVQGCWLDWSAIRAELLGSVSDLLKAARLERVDTPGGRDDDERRLAALPVRLVPGALPAPATGGRSPVRLSLAGAWAGLLLGAAAVAGLLHGVLTLSERRRVFVSAVTHELRTPLTTFRLYAEMLEEGMVSGEDKRREYLARLRQEAHRLGHLVENVLFYARLDSGRGAGLRESLELGTFLREKLGPLAERAERAGLRIDLEIVAPKSARVRADGSALEQVLLNLVDNACKYAPRSSPPTIEVRLEHDAARARIRVRDHGPGLSPAEKRRLFRPFSKSDREAATSAPGVGLGLALSRRLARAQGGDLRAEEGGAPGATFVLELPLDSGKA